jgi:hypothetical protein
MLERMVDCAHYLGAVFAEAAKANAAGGLPLGDAFLRCFHAVRMGIRLCLTLRTPGVGRQPAACAAGSGLEREPPERERLDHRPERESPPDRERDRDEDYEPVSLPKFLATLRGVAADAARLPATADAPALPRLDALLARIDAAPAKPAAAPAMAGLARPPRPEARSRLLGSASAPLALRSLRPPPKPSG